MFKWKPYRPSWVATFAVMGGALAVFASAFVGIFFIEYTAPDPAGLSDYLFVPLLVTYTLLCIIAAVSVIGFIVAPFIHLRVFYLSETTRLLAMTRNTGSGFAFMCYGNPVIWPLTIIYLATQLLATIKRSWPTRTP